MSSSFRTPAYLPAAASLVYRPLNPSALKKLGRGRSKKWPIIPLIVLGAFVLAIMGFVVWSIANRSKTKTIPSPPFTHSSSYQSPSSDGRGNVVYRDRVTPQAVPPSTSSSPMTPPSALSSSHSIFVSIPSYRDSETSGTLYSLIQNAASPQRVFIGLCQQNAKEDGDAIQGYNELCNLYGKDLRYMDNIRVIRWRHDEAEGPCKARSTIEVHLYKGEDYILQIDAHTRCEPRWDEVLIEEWTKAVGQAGHSSICLTGYPPSYRRYPGSANASLEPALPTFMSPTSFDPSSELPIFGSRMCAMKPPKPFPQLGWAGCFSFSLGSRLAMVPYLTKVPFLFFGEEFVMGALLWTHGWDAWMPTRMPLRTLFDRSHAPTFWEVGSKSSRGDARASSLKRIFALLQGREADHPLGTSRPLASYEAYLGISLMNRTMEPLAMAGVSPDASEHEIVAKYGSVTALQSTVQDLKTNK